MNSINTEIFDFVQAVVYLRDMENNLIYINPVAEKWAGIAKEDAINRKCYEVFGDLEHSCHNRCPVEQAITNHASHMQIACCPTNLNAPQVSSSTTVTPIIRDGVHLGALVFREQQEEEPEGHSPQKQLSITSLQEEIVKRKNAETALMWEKQLFMNGPVVVFHWSSNADWPVEYVSENITQYGYSKEQFLSGEISFLSIIHHEDREMVILESTAEIQAQVNAYELEFRIYDGEGNIVWVKEYIRINRDTNNNVANLYGYLIDITARKTIEHELEENQRQNLEAQEHARLGHWEYILPHGPIKASAEVYRIFGLKDEQENGIITISTFRKHIHPDDGKTFRQRFFRAIKNKSELVEEYRAITPEGKIVHVVNRSNVHLDRHDRVIKCFGTVQDITELKMVWDEVWKSRDMLNRVINTIPQALFWKDCEGRFLGCNHVFAKEFGRQSPNEVIGLTDYDLGIIPEDVEGYQSIDQEVLRSGLPRLNIEEKLRQKDGSLRWLSTSKAPLFDENQKPFGVIGVFGDITQRKAMEDMLEKRLVTLTQPLDEPDSLEFEDLFNLEDIQQFQDTFAKATGVACVICKPDGTPITKPSSITGFCDIIRQSERGRANCRLSDRTLGRFNEEGANFGRCLSGGLWDAGAAITVEGKHLASWLIGQVRDKAENVDSVRKYAREIGCDEDELVKEFRKVPFMPFEQFSHVSQALFTLTKHLSTLAYKNIQQARYITRQKEVERELLEKREIMAESQAQLSMALSIASMGHWQSEVDSDGRRILSLNEQLYTLFATTAEREGGMKMPYQQYCDTFLHPDDKKIMERENEYVKNAHDDQIFRYFEHRIIRRDGKIRHMAVRYRKVQDQEKNSYKLIGINQDITDRKISENNLNQAKLEAETANRAKSVFLANMSHEIRTPINGVMGMLQVMQLTNKQQEHEEYIDLAIQSSKRLARLLADILDLSRVEAGKMTITKEPFVLQEFLDSVAQLFGPTAKAKGLSFQVQSDQNIPLEIIGDSVRLQQILVNLLGNALKFTFKGTVTLEVTTLPSFIKDQCRLLFIVRDTGIGISDTTFTMLFNPFSQDETRYQNQFGGAGLGLTISKQLVDLMGGSMAVESEEDSGSTFYLCLPFQLPEKNSEEKSARKQNHCKLHLRVLLAEDDTISRLVGEQLLKNIGVDVISVEDGAMALEKLKNDEFDLAILDLQMPNLDGIETARSIRRGCCGEKNQDLPLIAMTAFAMESDRKRVFAAGMNGFVTKPVERERLEEEIRHVLIKKGLGLQMPELHV